MSITKKQDNTKNNDKKYLVVTYTGTHEIEGVSFSYKTALEIQSLKKTEGIENFAIIDGVLIKNFNQKSYKL